MRHSRSLTLSTALVSSPQVSGAAEPASAPYVVTVHKGSPRSEHAAKALELGCILYNHIAVAGVVGAEVVADAQMTDAEDDDDDDDDDDDGVETGVGASPDAKADAETGMDCRLAAIAGLEDLA
jgi:hypothetical protein